MSLQPNPDRRPRPGRTGQSQSMFSMELSRNLRVDSVARLELSPPLAIEETETVSSALDVMRNDKAGCLLVTRGGQLVGIFTERDLLTRVLAANKPLSLHLSECLTNGPVRIEAKDSIQTAIERMEKGGYRHLPVVDETNRPVGILSAQRIVHYLAEHFPALVYNQPPDPKKVPESAEGA